MARSNRAQRRRATARHIPASYSSAALAGALPGLPGGVPYVTDEERAAFAADRLSALEELHPGFEARRVQIERLGIAGRLVVRHAREAAPDGLGQGVLLGEFEEDVPSLAVLKRRLTERGAVVFE